MQSRKYKKLLPSRQVKALALERIKALYRTPKSSQCQALKSSEEFSWSRSDHIWRGCIEIIVKLRFAGFPRRQCDDYVCVNL